MKKAFKILIYALILSVPLALIITMCLTKVFFNSFFVINTINTLVFIFATFLITIFIGYWLSESDRKYLKYDEVNIEIMKDIFIPKPINNETSTIVKYIYDLRLQGLSYSKIAINLNEQNILSSCAYLYKIGILKNKSYKDKKWVVSTVKSILSSEIYIGNMVQGKKMTNLLKNKKYEVVKSDEWIVVKGTHKPIIEEEIFYKVQEINKNVKEKYEFNIKNSKPKKTTINIFKGIITCGCCNSKLNRKEEAKVNVNETYRFFQCNNKRIKQCNFTTINEDIIKEVVFEQLKNEIVLINQFKSFIKENHNIINFEMENLKSMLKNISLEIEKINIYNKNIYEDYIIGILTKNEYLFIKDNYLEKINTLIKNKEELEEKLIDIENTFINNKYINVVSQFNSIDILTKEIIQTFINEIIVYEDKTIQIKFKYKDEYLKAYYELERILKNVI